ncbi:hypothetical protein [Candidatus Nitrosocosmicus sp. FF01]|jgi:hypothetical protein|uniref:hypothetical protein n=1 Tax=Candidatus Nitrosocosmicus sp. FF01 TaxID=3397670 RepID=UPI0039E98648
MKNKCTVTLTSLMAISLICFICSAPLVFGVPPDPNFGSQNQCSIRDGPFGEKDQIINCCWDEPDLLNPGKTVNWCQSCINTIPPSNCSELYIETPSSPQDPASPIQDDGVLEQPDKPNKGSVMNLPSSNERTLE